MSYDVQIQGDIEVERTISIVASEIPILGTLGTGSTTLTSNVKIKRPDGTWATILQVLGVHLRLPDGTWQIFD